MTRIFPVLALFCLGLLIANITLGLWGGDYNVLSQQLWATQLHLGQLRSQVPRDEAAIDRGQQQMAVLHDRLRPVKRVAAVHILLGILAALVTVLVNSISVTYFIGTSRWCKEVADVYRLDPELPRGSARLKRRSFPWALMGVLVAVGIVTLGAAADPGTLRQGTGAWVLPHALAAIVGTALIAGSLYVQYGRIVAHYQIIQAILAQVQRIRRERGLV